MLSSAVTGRNASWYIFNYTLKILEKIKGHALVNKEKKISTRITWNSGMTASKNKHEQNLNNFQSPIQAKN